MSGEKTKTCPFCRGTMRETWYKYGLKYDIEESVVLVSRRETYLSSKNRGANYDIYVCEDCGFTALFS